MLSYIAHYRNKYPGGQVQASEHSLDVYDAEGRHVVALRKDGAGQWMDKSEEFGCEHAHCLSPIPKDARVHKIVDGKLGLDEYAEERMEFSKAFAEDGRVPSCDELKKDGWRFDEKQRVVQKPA